MSAPPDSLDALVSAPVADPAPVPTSIEPAEPVAADAEDGGVTAEPKAAETTATPEPAVTDQPAITTADLGAITAELAAIATFPSADPATARRRDGRRRWAGAVRVARRLVGLAFLVALWQVLSVTGVLAPTVIASPWEVVHAGGQLISDGELSSALLVSLQRVLLGLLIGGFAGVSLALLSGLFRVGEDFIDAPVQMLRTVPFVGLIPLLIIWFGIGEAPKVALVALAVTFPLYLNLYNGIRGTDVTLLEAGRSLGLNRWQLVWHVILPGALPSTLLGLRIALGVAWIALVFAEQVSAVDGLGYLMTNAQELFRTDVIVVCLVVYALLGLLADLTVRLLERALLSWRPAFSGQ